MALQRETFFVGGVRVARRPAETDHRIVLSGFEVASTQEARVLVRLEVRHANDDRPRPERRGDGANPLGQALDEEVLTIGVVPRQLGEFGPDLRVAYLLGVQQSQGMSPDRFADDEFHTCEPHAVVRKERRLEGEIGITEVDHDLGVGSGKIADVAAIDVESHFAAIDPTAVALSTRDRYDLSTLNGRGRVAGSHDRWHAEFSRDDCRVAGPATSVGDDGRGRLHYRFPVRGRRISDEDFARLELRKVRHAVDDSGSPRRDLLSYGSALNHDFAAAVEHVGLEQ